MRLGVGLSGGADSVALLRALHERAGELGLVLHAAHLHHGLRGEEADVDLDFCRALAAKLGVDFHEARVDTAAAAKAKSETIEEAARHLRYAWFRQLMSGGPSHAVVDAVATAHTRDDQAETVLAKFLRGAWTDGLSGIYPVLHFAEGRIVRPLLAATRPEIETFLKGLGQPWREDSSNRHLTYARNRIRHELLPLLEGWNPQLREHLARMADLARDEEAWWQSQVATIAPQLLLPGRPVRGGGRAAGNNSGQSLALDVTRLAALAPAMQRRLLRYAALQLGAVPDLAATEALRGLALAPRSGRRLQLAQGLVAERTPRELRLCVDQFRTQKRNETAAEYRFTIPGEVAADAFGIRLRVELASGPPSQFDSAAGNQALVRNWRAGDRVTLRYSSGPRKVKEVLERLRVTGSARAPWPVLETGGRIVWMQGVELEPEAGIRVTAEAMGSAPGTPGLS